jgi:hypothetical protein
MVFGGPNNRILDGGFARRAAVPVTSAFRFQEEGMSARYQVSRFERINDRWQATQNIGSPYETFEEAAKKLSETRKAFGHFRFDIREIPDAPVQEQPAQAVQAKPDWLKFWNPKSVK